MCSLLQTIYVTLRQTTYLLVGSKGLWRHQRKLFFCRHTSLAKGDTKIFLTETLISYSFTFGKQINEENLATWQKQASFAHLLFRQ